MARWKKGQSGNPAGRSKGTPDRRTKLRDLIDPHAEILIQTIVTAALAGDMQAARILMDRACPSLKAVSEPAPLQIDLSGSPTEQSQAILKAVSEGILPIDEAVQLLAGVASGMKILEISLLEQRLEALEQEIGGRI